MRADSWSRLQHSAVCLLQGTGLSEAQAQLCDGFVYIQQYGAGTASLNVSVAAAIVLHHFALWAGFPDRSRQGEKFDVGERPVRRVARGETISCSSRHCKVSSFASPRWMLWCLFASSSYCLQMSVTAAHGMLLRRRHCRAGCVDAERPGWSLLEMSFPDKR